MTSEGRKHILWILSFFVVTSILSFVLIVFDTINETEADDYVLESVKGTRNHFRAQVLRNVALSTQESESESNTTSWPLAADTGNNPCAGCLQSGSEGLF